MKRRFTILTAALALLAILAIPMGIKGQTRAEEVYSTCLFGSDYNSNGVSSYTATWTTTNDDFSWTIVNGNNNNNGWTFVKFGRKNNASVGSITTDEAYDEAISKVELTIDAITAGNINSIKLFTSSDNDAWTEAGSFAKATGVQTVALSSPATDLYYMIEFDCASGTSNGLVTVSKIEYYYNTGGAASPTISADDVELAYDATSGEIEYTVNNPVQDGELTADTEAEWLTIGTVGDDAVAFSCLANDGALRTATVTLTYTYNNDNVTKNVTVTQAANPNGPGSQANPYTVAQARAAIDAGTGVTGVYATGIVSAIPTAYNSQYSNITFNMVDETGDEVFLQAYRCGGTLASEVAVGDVAVVYGNLTKYGSTYEFGQGCEVVSLTHPTVTVEAPTFDPVDGTSFGNEGLSVSLTCATEGADIYYTLDGSEPDMSSTMYENPISLSETTTIKAIAYDGNDNASSVATATYTYVDPNSPGTQNNPYTVAQAIEAIVAGEGTQNVYATGIVSAIVTEYNSQYGNITFDIVDETGDEAFVRAYRCGGSEAADVTVGDVAVIYGNLTYFNNSIYEFTQNCELVSLTHPVNTEPSITVTPVTVDADATGEGGSQAVSLPITYENMQVETAFAFGVQFYDAQGEEQTNPSWIVYGVNGTMEEGYFVSLSILDNDGEARSTSLKVYAMDNNNEEVYSNLVTINQAEYVAPALDYAELPFEWEGGSSTDFLALNGTSANGLGSDYASGNAPYLIKFDGNGDYIQVKTDSRPGFVTIGVKMIGGPNTSTITVQGSADGVDFTDIQVLTISGAQNSVLTLETTSVFAENDRYVRLYFTKGSNVGVGPITIAQYTEPVIVPSITITPDELNVDAEQHLVNYLNLTYANIVVENPQSFTVHYYDAEGEEIEIVQGEAWMVAGVVKPEDVYQVVCTIMANEGEARSAYFRVSTTDTDKSDIVYSNLVTVNQDAYVEPATPGNWVLTDLADLTENDVFVIVGDNGNTYAMSNDNGLDAAPSAVPVSVVDNTLSGEIAENIQWNISGSASSGYTFYPNGSVIEFLFCNNSNNGLRVGGGEEDETSIFNITDDYLYNIGQERYVGIYNSQDWRSYTSINNNIKNQTFAFYKKVVEPETETYTLNIKGYGDSEKNNYYLIALPIDGGEEGVMPTTIDGMITDQFDLYYFDEGQEDEWINYDPNMFNLESGKGYLYASQDSTTLTFAGRPIEGTVYEVKLHHTDDAQWAGWNLVGNPFPVTANIIDDYEFYTLNADGNELVPSTNRTVKAMEGIFVKAEQEQQPMTFSIEGLNKSSMVALNLSDNNSLIDRAIIRFGESRQLPKFQLKDNSTKVYIPQDGTDFAVVRSEAQGEMPVNFSASENGTYTFSVNTENVEMNYLHLIDNMTGADIDLIANPSYSFEAKVTDHSNRFRLVFNANNSVNEQNSETFAFFNGNDWTIYNEGEAILQVVDMSGRVLSTETVNGNATTKVNAATGVYMLRLTNGNNVKTQKVVVK